MTYCTRQKELYDELTEFGNDFIDLIDDAENDEHKDFLNKIHGAYIDILKLTKRLHRKGDMDEICFLLVHILMSIHRGQDYVDNLLTLLNDYHNLIIELEKEEDSEDTDIINLYDENGNKMRIDDLEDLMVTGYENS